MIVKIETYHGFRFIANVSQAISINDDEMKRPLDTNEEVYLTEFEHNINYGDVYRTLFIKTPDKEWYIRTNSRVWLISEETGKTIDKL